MPKGAPDGHKIPFSGKSDEILDGESGDVIVALREQAHHDFKRKGDDLFIKRTISLSEALCGFRLAVVPTPAPSLQHFSRVKTGRGTAHSSRRTDTCHSVNPG